MATKINQNTVESIQFTLKKLVDSYNLEKDILDNLEHEIENSDLPNFNHEELKKYGLDNEVGVKLFFLGIYNVFIYGSMRESTSPDIVRFTVRKFTWYRSLFSFLKNFTAKQVDDLFSLIKVPSNIGKELVVKSPPKEDTESLKSILHPTVWDSIDVDTHDKIIEVKENETVTNFRNEIEPIANDIFNQYMAIDNTVIPDDESFFRNRKLYTPIMTKHTKEYSTDNNITEMRQMSNGRQRLLFSENKVFSTGNICGNMYDNHIFKNAEVLEILDTPFCSDMDENEWDHYVKQLKSKTNLRINDSNKLYKVLDKVDKMESFTVNDWTIGWDLESKKNLLYAATKKGVEDLLLRRIWSTLSYYGADMKDTYEENLEKLKENKPELYKITVEKLRYRNWLFTGYPIGLDENPENKMINNNIRKYDASLEPSNINPIYRNPIYNYSGLTYSWENKNDKLTYYNGLGTYGFHSLLDKKEDNRSIKDKLNGIKDLNKEHRDRKSNILDSDSGYNHPHYHVLKELLMMLTPYDGENTYDLVKEYAKKLDNKQISIEDFMEICIQRKMYNTYKGTQFKIEDEDEEPVTQFITKGYKMPVTGSIDSIPAIDFINRAQSEKGVIIPNAVSLKADEFLKHFLDRDIEGEKQVPYNDYSDLKLDYQLANEIRNQNLYKLNDITTLGSAS